MYFINVKSSSLCLKTIHENMSENNGPDQTTMNQQKNVCVQSGNIQSKRHVESATLLYFEPRRLRRRTRLVCEWVQCAGRLGLVM